MKHQHGARTGAGGIAQGDRIDLEHARLQALEPQLVVKNGCFVGQPGRQRRDLVMADRLQQGAAHHLAGKTKQRLGRAIGQGDAAARVEHDEPVHHAVQQGLEPAPVGFQRRRTLRTQRLQRPGLAGGIPGRPTPDAPPPGEGQKGKEGKNKRHGRQGKRPRLTSQP